MKTPCIKVCKLDEYKQYCIGCGRTIKQITDWSRYTELERETIMKTNVRTR